MDDREFYAEASTSADLLGMGQGDSNPLFRYFAVQMQIQEGGLLRMT